MIVDLLNSPRIFVFVTVWCLGASPTQCFRSYSIPKPRGAFWCLFLRRKQPDTSHRSKIMGISKQL